jgi:membrane protease subunit HflK
VVRRFGQVVAPKVTEGLHYRLPWPIDQEDIVNISEVRRESVGLVEPESEHPLHLEGPSKLQVLSGDTNIVDYEVIVQYQIGDPVAFLFNVDYPAYQLVRDAVRAAVTRLSGSTGVDDILTTERQKLQNDVRQEVQTLLDQYNSGLVVVGVNFQKAYPPDDVADTFRDVSSAREDKDRAINEAEGYRNSVIPEARGQAQQTLAEAASFAQVQQDQATGAAQSFDAILAQYSTNSKIYGEDVTRFRLYLESMEKVLPRVQTYVVKPGERVSLRLLNGSQVATFPPVAGGQ